MDKPVTNERPARAESCPTCQPGGADTPAADLKTAKNFVEHPLTVSGVPVKVVYGPEDIKNLDYARDLGHPGEFPFTRGVRDNMYRGRLWTFRQFSGFGGPEETNQRYKYLIAQGQTGLSVAFDFPTLYGYDSDSPFAEGEVGRAGVAIASLQDMETLMDGIDQAAISTSMTINPPANVLLAFYMVAAERKGIPSEKLTGTIQNDMLKEFQAQKTWIVPPQPSVRMIVDTVEYCAKHVPRWNTISISGYHIREAGSTAVQELAFTLANGFAYVEACIERGLDVDSFAPRFSHFFNSHLDFFEEIAKYRAARRIWARRMRDKYGAKNPLSMLLRFHTQTAGCSLTAQQPYNNIIRATSQAMAAVLGGTQSLHVNSMDEVLALPTEKAVEISLRTQQICAYELGIANTIDPLAGSYFVEALTNEMEEQAEEYFRKIEALGGVVAGIDKGFFQMEIAQAAFAHQQRVETGERVVVGVNNFVTDEELRIEILRIPPEIEQRQVEKHQAMKRARDQGRVTSTLENLQKVCSSERGNTMEAIVECVRAECTLQEITDLFRSVWGVYRDPAMF
jgi:methylmalonyl-CoA mutase N-terminal domain/subunit